MLTQWVLHEPCRLVALLGIGGIGKTTLAVRLARDVAPAFARVYWRSVRNAPPMHDWLGGAIAFLSDHELLPPDGEMARLKVLLQLLRDQPCLLVLDNLEPLLQAGGHGGAYLEGFSGYGTLLRMLAEGEHQSCLVFTSREAPSELAELAGGRALRTLELGGLSVTEVQALLSDRHLRGGEPEWASLVTRYGGNGLALKVVAESVVQVFGGDIAAFLEQAGFGTFGGIRRLLDGQVDRLSLLEQQILAWLGLEREPATFGQLVADLGSRSGRGELLEAVEALRRRSLIDRAQRGAAFTLQSVVLEYVTDRLLERATDEIEQGQFALLKAHALLKAQAKDYVRRTQERLLMAPLLERLVASYGTRDAVEQRCIALLDQLRQLPQGEQRYGPGNLVNLLRVSRGDLNGLDLSGLSIRQAFLQDIEAHDTSLAGARLDQAVLAEAFNYPSSVALDADGTLLAAGTSTEVDQLVRVRLGIDVDLKITGQLFDRFQALDQESALRLISRDPPNLPHLFHPIFAPELLENSQLLGFAVTLQNPVKARLFLKLKSPEAASELARNLHNEPQKWLRLQDSTSMLYAQPPEISRQAANLELHFTVPEETARLLLQRIAKTDTTSTVAGD